MLHIQCDNYYCKYCHCASYFEHICIGISFLDRLIILGWTTEHDGAVVVPQSHAVLQHTETDVLRLIQIQHMHADLSNIQ